MKPDIDAAAAGEAMVDDLMRFMPEGMSPNGWAVAAGVNRTVWGDIRRHGNPSRRTLARLLDVAGSSLAEFEALRVGVTAIGEAMDMTALASPRSRWRGPPPKDMPIFAAQECDPIIVGAVRVPAFRLDRVIRDRIARPHSLQSAVDSFGFTIPVSNMWPRFRAGRTLLVTPSLAPTIGEDLLLTLIDKADSPMMGSSFVAELVWQDSDAIRVRYFSPGVELTVERRRIGRIERIVGEAI